ncbi:MAG TPA: ferredoxin [Streptomyces sp.]|uniref:ferredoxin n=1 Tax=Streptomyces sp. TaxID=1931 RepID=UPI002D0F0CE0|nr:ferredoxin [Streptomyces sp.]HWU10858.1 ferredoxin [Streptomyces sp.]
MRIGTRPDRCIGAGHCVLNSPDLFDQSEAMGTVVVLAEEVPRPLAEQARAAIDACPTSTLYMTEE